MQQLLVSLFLFLVESKGEIMKLDNKTYDVLAFIGRVVLPALSVLYATLGEIWHLPYTKEIPLTITAFDLFLNTLLGISSNNYYKETLNNHSTLEG